MSVILEFAMFPTDKGESVSPYVSQIVAMIRDSGIDYRLTSMGTIIETETLEEALAAVQGAYDVLDRANCKRVYGSLKIDIRKGRTGGLKGKLDSVRDRIGGVSE